MKRCACGANIPDGWDSDCCPNCDGYNDYVDELRKDENDNAHLRSQT
jgi:hypothetical protein